jgi:2-keto-3-deoxygluconate permease
VSAALRALTRSPILMVLVPLAAGIGLGVLPHGGAFGPFSAALGPQGALTTVGLLLVCVGAQISPHQLGNLTWRVALILAACTLLPAALVVAYVHQYGPGGVLGISGLAAASCLCTSNAVWLALSRRYGSLIDQWSGTVAAALNTGPVVPLLLLIAVTHGVVGPQWAASAPAVLDATLPLLVGFGAGLAARAAGRDLAAKLRPAIPYLMVVFCVQLGARIRPARWWRSYRRARCSGWWWRC